METVLEIDTLEKELAEVRSQMAILLKDIVYV